MTNDYDEHFTAFVDFLGFADAVSATDETSRIAVLDLLRSLADLRSEFQSSVTARQQGQQILLRPAISTFSDHIVLSYPLEKAREKLGEAAHSVPFIILAQFTDLLATIAVSALKIGFLIRGGVTIGKLYHAGGVVFGEAMVEAFLLESRTAVYPRVVISRSITEKADWMNNELFVAKDFDGICYIDYIRLMLLRSSGPGEGYNERVAAWFATVAPIVHKNLTALEAAGRLNELSKWAWFARRFRDHIAGSNPDILRQFGISLDQIPW